MARGDSGTCARARSEGIYEAVSGIRVRCVLCGTEMIASALARAAHGKKHVRAGEAVALVEFTDDGPRTTYTQPAACDCEGRGWVRQCGLKLPCGCPLSRPSAS